MTAADTAVAVIGGGLVGCAVAHALARTGVPVIVIEAERRPQHALEADLFGVFRLPRNVSTFIEQVLVPSADAYRRICRAHEGASRKQRRINGYLIGLLRCTHSAWKAPAILALREFGAATPQLEAFLADLERLASVLMIIGFCSRAT